MVLAFVESGIKSSVDESGAGHYERGAPAATGVPNLTGLMNRRFLFFAGAAVVAVIPSCIGLESPAGNKPVWAEGRVSERQGGPGAAAGGASVAGTSVPGVTSLEGGANPAGTPVGGGARPTIWGVISGEQGEDPALPMRPQYDGRAVRAPVREMSPEHQARPETAPMGPVTLDPKTGYPMVRGAGMDGPVSGAGTGVP
jgi:hypothetical protein